MSQLGSQKPSSGSENSNYYSEKQGDPFYMIPIYLLIAHDRIPIIGSILLVNICGKISQTNQFKYIRKLFLFWVLSVKHSMKYLDKHASNACRQFRKQWWVFLTKEILITLHPITDHSNNREWSGVTKKIDCRIRSFNFQMHIKPWQNLQNSYWFVAFYFFV